MIRCSNKQFVLLSVIIVFSMFLFTSRTIAQGIPMSDGLNITLSTDNPLPGQVVSITVNSYGDDISAAKMVWSVNGKVVKNEIGLNTIDVNAPALGAKLEVTITATTPDGSVVRGSTTITSGVVDMIVESDGYVPPLFFGKTAIGYQNSVKITAIPHLANSSGKEYDASKLVYRWKKGGSLIQEKSGYGKQSIVIAGDIIPRAYEIEVTVSESTSGAQAVGISLIEPQEPSISFYVNDPLYGTLYNRAIGNSMGIGSQNERGILAVLFGFNKGTSLSWLINGESHPELNDKSSVILRSSSADGGSSIVHLDASNANNILQGARSEFTVLFGPSSDATTTNSYQL
ncbi:MAG: hypothetical protein WCK03_01450 [Candidatus Taylorbacteria bacterium]